MVETTIRTVDRNVSYLGVHASRGKITRAEPIAALAEQRRIHHVGVFPELEDQLCSFAGGAKDSPDRLDAMVWAFTELMVGEQNTGILEFYRQEHEQMVSGRQAIEDARIVRVTAPEGVSHIQLRSGVTICIPADRILTLQRDDAFPLMAAGWKHDDGDRAA